MPRAAARTLWCRCDAQRCGGKYNFAAGRLRRPPGMTVVLYTLKVGGRVLLWNGTNDSFVRPFLRLSASCELVLAVLTIECHVHDRPIVVMIFALDYLSKFCVLVCM